MHTAPLSRGIGVAFKPQHFAALIADISGIDLLEIHAENYFGDGGLLHHQLERLCALLPLSIHGVGLSLGGAAPLNPQHLQKLKQLCDRYSPALVSEHLAWAGDGQQFLADLLPVAYTTDTLNRSVDHVAQLQDVLGRRVLIENPASYLRLKDSHLREADFLAELSARSGCGLLLDLNNLLINCHNNGGTADQYLRALPLHSIGEVHLAGHAQHRLNNGRTLLIDDHGSAVTEPTLRLYQRLLRLAGSRPTIIEWDRQVPSWTRLLQEVTRARQYQRGQVNDT